MKARTSRNHPSLARRLGLAAGVAAGYAAVTLTALQPSGAAILDGSIQVGVKTVADGLVSPLGLTHAPGDSRLFVLDQQGQVRIVENGVLLPQAYLDVSATIASIPNTTGTTPFGLRPNYDERGLLGLAFHPDYANNGKIYAYYSAPGAPDLPSGWNHTSRISEFTVSANPNVVNAASERIIMTINQPQSNHNGGHMQFGPDGFLYISTGDGGAADDKGTGHNPDIGNAQDLSSPLGKMLRLDVNSKDAGKEYAVPPSNPFVSTAGAVPEIWAFGLRNPYSFSFDRGGTNQMFIGDVGQLAVEEINIGEAGANYGWQGMEGTLQNPNILPGNVGRTGLTGPIAQYDHTDGIAVIGGFVYRGSMIPELQGKYVFGDLSGTSQRGRLLYIDPAQPGLIQIYEFKTAGGEGILGQVYLKGLGEDASGELYALVSSRLGPSNAAGGFTPPGAGMVLQIVPEPSSFAALASFAGLAVTTLVRRTRRH